MAKFGVKYPNRKSFSPNEKTRRKISQSLKGVNTWTKGKKVLYRKSPPPFTEEHRRKIGRSWRGKKRPSFSEEWKKNMQASHKGKISNFKGKKHTEKSKEKISINQLGKKLSIETRRKQSEALRGEKSYLWKGGITPINTAIRESFEYRLWREAVFQRDDWTCNFCGKRGIYLEADHIKRFSDYPELRFAIDNGRTLCRECHRKTNTYGYRIKNENIKGNQD